MPDVLTGRPSSARHPDRAAAACRRPGRCDLRRLAAGTLLAALLPLAAAAQAISPSGAGMVLPVPTSGGVVNAAPAVASHPTAKRKSESKDAARAGQDAPIPPAPGPNPSAPGTNPSAPGTKMTPASVPHVPVWLRLRELDRLAHRGTMSLEDYRTLRANILRGS